MPFFRGRGFTREAACSPSGAVRWNICARKFLSLGTKNGLSDAQMKIRAGYKISYVCLQPTPMMAMLSVHPSRTTALLTSDLMRTDPSIPAKEYMDGFGNICHVIHAPAGNISVGFSHPRQRLS